MITPMTRSATGNDLRWEIETGTLVIKLTASPFPHRERKHHSFCRIMVILDVATFLGQVSSRSFPP